MMYAAKQGDRTMVDLLLVSGADVNAASNNGWTALMLAAVKNHAGLAGQLLARGADVNAADAYGWTPLLRAVYEKRPAVVRVLLRDASIDVNARNEHGGTALHYAAALGDPEMVRSLLHKGADADARDASDRTPRTMAIEQGKVEVVRILSER